MYSQNVLQGLVSTLILGSKSAHEIENKQKAKQKCNKYRLKIQLTKNDRKHKTLKESASSALMQQKQENKNP